MDVYTRHRYAAHVPGEYEPATPVTGPVEAGPHEACVCAWLGRVGRDPAPARLLDSFEQGFAAVWRRAHQTLGEITLAAIVARVLDSAAERFPLLASLELETTGISFAALRARVEPLRDDQLGDALHFVLVELFAVLGKLTAEILTPALHAELLNVARPAPPERAQPPRAADDREDAGS